MAIRTTDHRRKAIAIAGNLLTHKGECYYSEYSNRWDWRKHDVPTYPFTSDCSGTVTAINYWAGGNDPNGTDFAYGNTRTILSHARQNKLIIARCQLIFGDFVLLGMEPDGVTPKHVVMALQSTLFHKDPICFSMGRQGDPNAVRLSVLEGIGSPIFVSNITRK